MDDPATVAIVVFFAAVFLGVALGGLTGWLTRFEIGMVTGLLCIAAGGLGGAGYLTLINLDKARDGIVVAGTLVDYQRESISTGSDGRSRSVRGWQPVIEFVAADGKSYRAVGLASGQRGLEAGTAVKVRYPPVDPMRATIVDFQNEWGGVFALCLFGGFPLLAGLFFLFSVIDATRVRRVRPGRAPSAWAQWCATRGKAISGWLNMAAALGMISAIVYAAYGDATMRSTGFAFIGIAAAVMVYAISFVISNGGWQSVFICCIIGAGFGAFGTGAVLLTQPAAHAAAAKRTAGAGDDRRGALARPSARPARKAENDALRHVICKA